MYIGERSHTKDIDETKSCVKIMCSNNARYSKSVIKFKIKF